MDFLEYLLFFIVFMLMFPFPLAIFLLLPPISYPYISYFIGACMTWIIFQQILEGLVSIFSKEQLHTPASKKLSITAILPMYLPNEQHIVFDTLDYFSNVKYEGGFNVILAYNTPVRLTIVEKSLHEYWIENSNWLSIVSVPNSKSKADNINYILDPENNFNLGDIICFYDADGHPEYTNFDRANYWISEKNADYVQGRCKIRTNGTIFDSAIDLNFSLMYQVCHKFRDRLFGYALFGGSNGFWKKGVIQNVMFDNRMLTEDIDCAVRAMELGYKGVYDNKIVASEEAPPSFWDFFVQRTRWAQGWFEVSIKHFSNFFTLPKYKWYQKAHIVNLFIIRELLSHVKLLAAPLLLAEYINTGKVAFNGFGTFVMFYSLAPYFIQTFAGFLASPIEFWNSKWKLSAMILCLVSYTFVESAIVLRAQLRHFCGLNNWIATPRNTQK